MKNAARKSVRQNFVRFDFVTFRFFLFYCFVLSLFARNAFKPGVIQSEKLVHFGCRIFVHAFCVVDENIVEFFYFSLCLHAEASYGGGKRKDPYRRTDSDMLIFCEVDINGGNRHFPTVHTESAAPPKAKRSFRALRAFNFVNIRAVSCRLPVCNVLNIPHAGKENRKAFFIAVDIAVDIGIQKQLMPSLSLNLIPAASSSTTQARKPTDFLRIL